MHINIDISMSRDKPTDATQVTSQPLAILMIPDPFGWSLFVSAPSPDENGAVEMSSMSWSVSGVQKVAGPGVSSLRLSEIHPVCFFLMLWVVILCFKVSIGFNWLVFRFRLKALKDGDTQGFGNGSGWGDPNMAWFFGARLPFYVVRACGVKS